MRTPLNPLGILLGHLLPAAILAFLFADLLGVVRPLLEPEHIRLWWIYAACLATATLLSTAYALMLLRTKKPVHFLYGVLVFLVYVPLLFTFMDQFRGLLPWELPRWMMPEDAELYAIRFLSIPMAHALFVLVTASLPEGERGKPLRDMLIAGSIPLACYLFVQVIEPWRWDIDFERHVWVVLFIVLVVAFLFFLFRGVAAMVRRRGRGSEVLGWIMRILVALVFPLLGLGFNNGLLGTSREVQGVFGDLSHWGFYVIAVLNAAVVLWPSSDKPRVRMLQFVLRGIGFSYVLYFFLLFLPFLPLSIVAIIAIGIGFLLLAPVLLFLVQGTQLLQDVRFLMDQRSRSSIALILLGSLAVLPGIITLKYLYHRNVLHAALDHVYHADLFADPSDPVAAQALQQVLDQVEGNKARSWPRRHTPFLTPYYNRIVLDNLTLGQEKLADLRAIFLDEPRPNNWARVWSQGQSEVVLDTATVKSGFDTQQQAWRTWVDLRMTNNGEGQGEYVTTFDLPDGAWISDEYLMITGERVPGILAEKKAAEWVYRQIVNVRRDPSITRYVAPGRVQLRVFPFAVGETREAGFEVLHKEPIALLLDSSSVLLGDTLRAAPGEPITTADGSTTYIPSALKNELPLVRRTASVHLIVDGSETQRGERDRVIQRIEGFIAHRDLDPNTVHVSIADAYVHTFAWSEDGADRFRHHAGHGGFFSDRAIRRIIVEACAHPGPETPLIILVPSQPMDSVASYGTWLDDLADIAQCLPEGDTFLVLGDGQLPTRRTFHAPEQQLNNEPAGLEQPHVRAWPDASSPIAYLRDDGKAGIVVDPDLVGEQAPVRERWWPDALALEGRWRRHQLRPNGGTAAWRDLVRGSFQAQVMTPVTAWMCLENDAQRNALLKKQRETLNADAALDIDDETITSMSEPGLLWLLVPMLVVFVLLRRKG